MKAAVKLAEYLRDIGHNPEQVQDFYPTPGTLSTAMYYTETDPRTGEKVYVPKTPHEKAMQRALMQYRNPDKYDLVLEALQKAKRTDLIGFDSKCLIRPRKLASEKNLVSKNSNNKSVNNKNGSKNNKNSGFSRSNSAKNSSTKSSKGARNTKYKHGR